jgi:hypothetical protein
MEMHLPSCATPRPGEPVIFYKHRTRFEGLFQGYNTIDQLLIQSTVGGIVAVDNFLQVRLKSPDQRCEGCWAALPKSRVLVKPTPDERDRLSSLLSQRIVPGPSYLEFITEIWSRGYEIFLVGGTVRDVLNGEHHNDVDLVTTIPFFVLEPLAEAMFGHDGYSRNPNQGFMSVGGGARRPKRAKSTGDPLIDVKNLFLYAPGTGDAVFGANLLIDQKLRDFACNAVYYDPMNEVLIDPSGRGIADAKAKILNIINDHLLEHPTFRKANIPLRFFKFLLRGYEPSPDCIVLLQTQYRALMFALGVVEARAQFYRFILGKVAREDQSAVFFRTKELMHRYGFDDIWERYYSELEVRYE